MLSRVMWQTVLAGLICIGGTAGGATLGEGPGVHYRQVIARQRTMGADVEDSVQEVCLHLLRAQPSYESEAHAKAWVARAIRNKGIDEIRKRCRRPTESLSAEVAAGGDDPAMDVERKETQELVRRAMEKLKAVSPARSFEVLRLRAMEGETVEAVAEKLDLTPSQVWAREHRMKAKLRGFLEAEGLGDGASEA